MVNIVYWIAAAIVLVATAAWFGSGMYLLFAYRPTLLWSYDDILALRDKTPLAIKWSATLLAAALILYLVVAVFVTVYEHSLAIRHMAGLALVVTAFVLVSTHSFGRQPFMVYAVIIPIVFAILVLASVWVLRPTTPKMKDQVATESAI